MASYKPVTAALRAFEVLSVLNRLPQPSFARIRKESGCSSATVVRMLETLVAAGLVAHDAERGLYVPTSKTLSLSSGYTPQLHLDVVAKPVLEELKRRIGWPSDIAICDRDSMVVVQTSRGSGRMFFDRRPGYRAPVLGTSLGIAFLAFSPKSVVDEIVPALCADPAAWNDPARDPSLLEKLLSDVRGAGYATMHAVYRRQCYDDEVSSVGVPVLTDKYAIATLNITYLTEVVDSSKAARKFVPHLQEAARRIASALK